MDQQVIGVPLYARGSAMFRTELNLIVELTNLRKRKAILDADRASHTACAPNSDDDQQIDADIEFLEDELTSLGGQKAAELAADAQGHVAAAMNATSPDSAERLLFIKLLARIEAEIASITYASSHNFDALSVASPQVANSSLSSASEVTAQDSASSSSSSCTTVASSPQDMPSPASDPENAPEELLRALAERVQRRVPLPAGALLSEDAMRKFAVNKVGLRVLACDGGAGCKFEAKVGKFGPVAMYKDLAVRIDKVYVDRTTKNCFDGTESAEAWSLAQLLSEYRDLRECLARSAAPAAPKSCGGAKRHLSLDL
jgi:hypothetical protein